MKNIRSLPIVLSVFLITASAMVLTAGGQPEEASSAEDDSVRITVIGEFTTAWVRNFNPYITNARHASRGFGYEYLVVFNEMDNMTMIPWLAEDVSIADDLQTITIKLRRGIKWSDGEDFDADDVLFTYKDYPQSHPEIDRGGLWGEDGRLRSVSAIDDYTLEMVLSEKNAFALSSLLQSAIIPRHIWEDIEDPATAVIENLVATGPLTEVVQFGPQLFIMGRNPYYWKADELKIDQMAWPQYNSNEGAYDALKSGKIDWAFVFIPDIENVYVDGNPDNRYWFPSNDGVRITLNFKSKNQNNRKAFSSIHFRRAFSLAMDRRSMMEIGAYGYVKGGNPATGLPPSLWGWRSEEADALWSEYYRYDLDAARAQLAEGGFADVDGDGFVENPDGTPIQFNIQVPSGWTDWVNNDQIAVEGLRKIGINAGVSTPEVSSYIAAWQPGDFDAMFAGNGRRPSIWGFYDHTMHSHYHDTPLGWSSNLTRYENSRLDDLIDEMKFTSDVNRQREIANEIEILYASEVVHIPLYYNGLWHLYSTARFEGWATEDDPFINPAVGSHDNKMIHLLRLRPR